MKHLPAFGAKAKLKFEISSIRSAEIDCKVKRAEYDRLALYFPDDKSDLADHLYEGKELEMLLFTNTGVQVLDSMVIDSPHEKEFVAEYHDQSKNIQRRKFIRMPMELKISLTDGIKTIETETIDVGSGGIRFKMTDNIDEKRIWNFKIISEERALPIKGEGRIINSVRSEKANFSVIEFTQISEFCRDRIVKLCFEEEARRIRGHK